MEKKISLETSKRISPERLREAYGIEVGNEICFILPMVASTDRAVTLFLSTLSDLSNTEQQLEFLNVVRNEYYKRVANFILKEFN